MLMAQETTEQQKATILAVDDVPENLDVLKSILASEYQVKVAISGAVAMKVIAKAPPDLILLDVVMPDMSGHALCETLKSQPETAKIPVIFVTAMSDEEDEEEGFRLGAIDYLTKPLQPAVVRARVRNHLQLASQRRACEAMVARRTAELEESQRSAVHMLGYAGHCNDTDTGVHVWRMAAYSAALARAVKWPVDQVALLELAALMHDTGKIGIPDAILRAPRRLTASEWEVMRSHTTLGHSILSKSDTPLFRMAADIALCHHEWWDGSGYPSGLAGENIPQAARIVTVADVFDALTIKRPYKQAWSVEKAFQALQEGAGKQFEPALVDVFFSIEDEILELKQTWAKKEQGKESY